MNKTGMVLKVNGNTALLMTSTGEFVRVKTHKNVPEIGDNYTGIQKTEINYFKYLTIVAMFLFVISCGSGYVYYTPAATVQVSINPQIELKINRFNRIIGASPLNADGKTILQNMNIKNKNIDDALISVVEEAKKDNFITDKYNAQGKIISVKIFANNSNKTININKFEKYIDQSKINSQFDNNGQKSELKFNEKDDSENIKNIINDKKSLKNENDTKGNDSIVNPKDTDTSKEDKNTINKSNNNSKDNTINENDTNNSNKDKVNKNKNKDDNKSNNNEKNNSEKHNNEKK